MLGSLNPVAGDQVNIVPPVAVNGVHVPSQILTLVPAFAIKAPTVTFAVVVLVQPLASVPVMVYVVVLPAVNVTVVPVGALNPVVGDQVYVLAPLAVNVVVPPGHTFASDTLITGNGLTVTFVVAVLLQPLASVPVTV
jgi:hypothetical protein